MDDFLNQFAVDPVANFSLRQLLQWAMQNFYAWTLVFMRMSGLMVVGPIFGQSIVPANIRILLVIVVSLLIAPLLGNFSMRGFQRLDVNQDNRLSREEIPEQLQPRFEKMLDRSERERNETLTFSEFSPTRKIPPTLLDYAWISVGEFSLGFVLGMGITTILSGLQLGGQLIDQQMGVALGEIFNPGLGVQSSISGQFLYLLGVTVFLVMEPLGGHLLVVSALVETFQTLPVGEAFLSTSAVELLSTLVHQSLVLAIQVAAPLLATMSLVALVMGFLGHTVPQINVLVLGFPIRAMVGLFILMLTISGAADAVVDTVPQVIDRLRSTLTALP